MPCMTGINQDFTELAPAAREQFRGAHLDQPENLRQASGQIVRQSRLQIEAFAILPLSELGKISLPIDQQGTKQAVFKNP